MPSVVNKVLFGNKHTRWLLVLLWLPSESRADSGGYKNANRLLSHTLEEEKADDLCFKCLQFALQGIAWTL